MPSSPLSVRLRAAPKPSTAVKQLTPDILLLDLQLGDMTGLDVLRRLGTGLKTKTILLGADIQRADELTAILLGASGCCWKVFGLRNSLPEHQSGHGRRDVGKA